jgi:hypothetical protein
MNATKMFGRPHYELVDRYGCQETVVGRYLTFREAELHKRYWEAVHESPYRHLQIRMRAL